jgi:2-haloacid dehalogenase
LAFDAYGTLFDVHSVVALCEQLWPGEGQRLSSLWRSKQLEYTWQLNRSGAPLDALGPVPDHVVKDLRALPALVRCR